MATFNQGAGPPGGPAGAPIPPAQQRKVMLDTKAAKWERMCKQKYATKRKFGFVEIEKEKMPPEHVRKVIKGEAQPCLRFVSLFALRGG